MNSDQIEGNWMQLKGKMREKWGKLTDNDWEQVAGKKDQLLGKLQERYGYTKEQAERDYDDWDRANQRTSKVRKMPIRGRLAAPHLSSLPTSSFFTSIRAFIDR